MTTYFDDVVARSLFAILRGILGVSDDDAGVAGASGDTGGVGVSGFAWGPGSGVDGLSRDGDGVSGKSVNSDGVTGSSASGNAVSGISYAIGRIGVRGANIGGGIGVSGFGGIGVSGNGNYGGLFEGALEPLWLIPSLSRGPPTDDNHNMGEFFVGNQGVLYFCTQDGTPGTWKTVQLI
jgi:hypothetical protein